MSDEVAAWKARIYQLNRMSADIDAEHRALSQRIAALVAKSFEVSRNQRPR